MDNVGRYTSPNFNLLIHLFNKIMLPLYVITNLLVNLLASAMGKKRLWMEKKCL